MSNLQPTKDNRTTYDEKTGAVRSFFGAELVAPLPEAKRVPTPTAKSDHFLKVNRALFKLENISLREAEVREGGASQSVRYQQDHHGIPVYGAQLVVGLRKQDGAVTSAVNKIDYELPDALGPGNGRLSADEIVARMHRHFGERFKGIEMKPPKQYVYRHAQPVPIQLPYNAPPIRGENPDDGHQPPINNQSNYLYVRVHNRGSQQAAANNFSVETFHCNPATAMLWPTHFNSMGTLPITTAVPAGGSVRVGPFVWTPQIVDHECLLAVVKGSTDPTIADDVKAKGAVAVILEVARILADVQLQDTVQFVGFSGEEQGLWGSTAYAQYIQASNINVHRLINLDMVGYPPADSSIIVERDTGNQTSVNDLASKSFGNLMAQVAADYTTMPVQLGPIYASDYMPFEARGYVVAGLYEGDGNPNYHHGSDDPVTVNYPYVADAARITLATTVSAAAGVIDESSSSVDVYIRDSAADMGDQPSGLPHWQSPDIWVRNNPAPVDPSDPNDPNYGFGKIILLFFVAAISFF